MLTLNRNLNLTIPKPKPKPKPNPGIRRVPTLCLQEDPDEPEDIRRAQRGSIRPSERQGSTRVCRQQQPSALTRWAVGEDDYHRLNGHDDALLGRPFGVQGCECLEPHWTPPVGPLDTCQQPTPP